MAAEDTKSVPVHLGIILDGNRRWAKDRGLPQMKGHQKGYDNLKTIVKAAFDRGIGFVSAYVFSTENWNRSKQEVSYLMDLAMKIATSEVEELHKENIRVRFLGTKDRLSLKLIEAIEKAEAKTKDNTRGTVALCFNYGGQQEVADAVNRVLKSGNKTVTANQIEDNLYAPDVPAVDFIIRTSGEQRISNFMLWRAAYSELKFVDKHWPDFSEADLDEALADYAGRKRRFGR